MPIISPLPYTFTNGTIADATQVDANNAQILANVNTNAAENGANSSITSLTGLTTPLAVAEGGTGVNNFTVVTASWTPVDASGAGLVFTSVSVNYTRLGNMVFVYGRFTYPATADGSNSLIGGLPIAVANHVYAQAPGPAIGIGGGAAQVVPLANTTTFGFFNASNGSNIPNSSISGVVVAFNFSYPVA